MAKEKTSLEHIYESMGVPDFGEVFPDAICKKCRFADRVSDCESGCAALITIGGLAVLSSTSSIQLEAQLFVERLKEVVKSIHSKG